MNLGGLKVPGEGVAVKVMQWMLSHQEARRNLSPGELIYANSMIAEEIAAENKAKRLSTLKQNQIDRSVQMDKTEDKEKSCTSPTHTREQVAKMSGVGAGTVARYDTKNLLCRIGLFCGEKRIRAGIINGRMSCNTDAKFATIFSCTFCVCHV